MLEKTENRELRIMRTFKAPIALMWEAWTQPHHLVNWWGPAGFTTTIHKMEFNEGGEWNLTLQGPNGTNYPNRSIYKEIIPFKKIVIEHFNPHFFTAILFNQEGNETQIEWYLLFDSVEMHNTVVKAHKADEGQKQNLEKLDEYLSMLQYKSSTNKKGFNLRA